MRTKKSDFEDYHGMDVIGLDDDGIWWGTPNAWWVYGDTDTSGSDENGVPDGSCDGPDAAPATPTYFEVSGFWYDGKSFTAYVVASSFEEVRHHAACHGCRDIFISPGVRLSKRHVYKSCGVVFLTDEQVQARLEGRPIITEDGRIVRTKGSRRR